jgi:alpha,alpha-trehalase
MSIKGVIFDMDGVVTQTAVLHFKAWKEIIDKLLYKITNYNIKPFSENEYFHYLDGMPRIDGMRNFLSARGFGMNKLEDLYESIDACVQEACENKNRLLLSMLTEEKVEYFEDTIEFIKFLLKHNYLIAIISSSKNCKQILKNAKIDDLFPVCVDGILSEELGLQGKPDPAIFLEAAKRLNLAPHECIIVEDALAGVKAGKIGGFGGVIALDRRNRLHDEFAELDPDYILPDLSSKQTQLYHRLEKIKKGHLESAFNIVPLLFDLLNNKTELVIFLDYDGTLTPIVGRPEHAVLSSAMHECLSQLSQHYLTIIISGRELANLKSHVNIPHIFYSGNHGFECEGPEQYNLTYQIGNEYIDDVNAVYQELYALFKNIKGCIVENKKFSLSVHYRLVNENLYEFISQQIDNALLNYPNLIRHYGKKVFEVHPNIQWNKGIAAAHILKQFKTKNNAIVPIYIGDDITDEDAFKKLGFRGITIKVTGEPLKTQAHYFLNSPMEVQEFLVHLNNFKDAKHESMDCQLSQF